MKCKVRLWIRRITKMGENRISGQLVPLLQSHEIDDCPVLEALKCRCRLLLLSTYSENLFWVWRWQLPLLALAFLPLGPILPALKKQMINFSLFEKFLILGSVTELSITGPSFHVFILLDWDESSPIKFSFRRKTLKNLCDISYT